MALVKLTKGVVISGHAYREGQIADLTGSDLSVALAHGFGTLYQSDNQPPAPQPKKRGKKS